MRTLNALGIPGVEIIGEQMFPGFPHLTSETIAKWRSWLDRYELTPTCHDMFLDLKRYRHRQLTHEECVESVLRDIHFASALGIPRVRVIANTPPGVLEDSQRYAERYQIDLLLEIHSPLHFRHEWIERHLEMMHRINSPFIGIMPDLGIFVRRFPRIIAARFIRDGATPDLVAELVGTYNSGRDLEQLHEVVRARGGNEKDIQFAGTIGHYCNVDPREMIPHMGLIRHCQAKFYEMINDFEEYSIPYGEIIAAFAEGGYDGWLSSEYEGNRHIQDVYEVDSVEQVRRHHEMMKCHIDGADTKIRIVH